MQTLQMIQKDDKHDIKCKYEHTILLFQLVSKNLLVYELLTYPAISESYDFLYSSASYLALAIIFFPSGSLPLITFYY